MTPNACSHPYLPDPLDVPAGTIVRCPSCFTRYTPAVRLIDGIRSVTWRRRWMPWGTTAPAVRPWIPRQNVRPIRPLAVV